MPAAELKRLIQKVSGGATLGTDEIRTALEIMTEGHASPAQMGAFLMALRVRGETVEEITGAAQMMRAKMNRVTAPDGAVDIVGTGGDGTGTFNVSTCSCLVAAGAGLKIAKHGNRSVSSLSGASDVLGALGVKLDIGPDAVAKAIADRRRRLHVGADAPSGHEALGADPGRTRHPHDLQSARADLESGRRHAAGRRRVLARMGRADRARAEEPWRGACLGRARSRRPRRADDDRRDHCRGTQGRADHRVRGYAGRRRPAACQALRSQGR